MSLSSVDGLSFLVCSVMFFSIILSFGTTVAMKHFLTRTKSVIFVHVSPICPLFVTLAINPNNGTIFGSLADCVKSAIEGRVCRDEGLWS